VKHYFINTKSVGELYGAGHYEKDALALLEQLFTAHDIIFLTGGSGLYINAILNGVDEFDEVPAEIRDQLNAKYKTLGLEWLQEEVKRHDPHYFETVDIYNPQRLIRALEVITHTGKPFSSFLEKQTSQRSFTAINVLLDTDREKLYGRINARVDDMMRHGLLEEVKALQAFREFNALKTVGYKELFDHFDGKLALSEAVDKIKQHTRNYAKRQLTWFRNKGDFETFAPEDLDKIIAYIDVIITNGQAL
jgi:tRNA dimethylallyltransferase